MKIGKETYRKNLITKFFTNLFCLTPSSKTWENGVKGRKNTWERMTRCLGSVFLCLGLRIGYFRKWTPPRLEYELPVLTVESHECSVLSSTSLISAQTPSRSSHASGVLATPYTERRGPFLIPHVSSGRRNSREPVEFLRRLQRTESKGRKRRGKRWTRCLSSVFLCLELRIC